MGVVSSTMTREEIEACWKDGRNWTWRVYHCKADPRVVVPKRHKWMGWTFNAAHLAAIPVTLLLIAVTLGPILMAINKRATTEVVFFTFVASVAVVCLVCAYLSSRTK